MGCNCRGKTTAKQINRTSQQRGKNNLCQQITREKNDLHVVITQSGEIILPTTKLPAHSSLGALQCKGPAAEKILKIELELTSLFSDTENKEKFLKTLGAKPTLGMVEALLAKS